MRTAVRTTILFASLQATMAGLPKCNPHDPSSPNHKDAPNVPLLWSESESYIVSGQAYTSVVKSGSLEAFKATTYYDYQLYLKTCYSDPNLEYYYNAANNMTLYCVSAAKTCDGDPVYSINDFRHGYCEQKCAWEKEQEKCNAGKSFENFESAWHAQAQMFALMTGGTVSAAEMLLSNVAEHCWRNPHDKMVPESVAGMEMPCMGAFEADDHSLCTIPKIGVAACDIDMGSKGCPLEYWAAGETCGDSRKLPPGCSVVD